MRRMRGEDGVALALALAFLAGFGVLTGALLGFAETGMRTTQAMRAQTQQIYALDGAVDGAINAIRNNILYGRDPAMSAIPCPSNTFSTGGVAVAVSCQGEAGSGWAPSGQAPDHAILTMSTNPGERGIEQVSNVSLTVNGSVFSNSDVLNSGTASIMTVDGDLNAIGTCTATPPAQILATGDKRCAGETLQADPTHGVDPAYSPVTASVPAYRAVPACPGANSQVDLLPGTYVDAAALTALTDGSCSRALVHLAPDPGGGVGVYYFDFRDSGAHEWVISDPSVNIVGGTAKNWIPVPGLRSIVPYPGACKVDSDNGTKDGIQVLFGGDSRVRVDGGKIELCPQPSVTSQEISLYGVRSGASTPVTADVPTTSVLSNTGYTNPGNAHAIEGAASPAEAVASLSVLQPAVNLQLQEATPSIPQGSLITSARLRIAHREGPTASAILSITATVALGGGSDSASVTPNATYSEDSFPLPGLAGVLVGGATPLRTSYSVLLNPAALTATSNLDGVVLEVTYEPPAFRAQSGCITTQPYVSGSATTCAVLRGTGSAGIAVQGTVYAPLAPIDVEVTNVSAQIFNRGIISRVVRLGVAPLAGFAGAPVGIVRADRVVSFSGTSGGTILKARATFEDGGGLTPGASVTIDRWTMQR